MERQHQREHETAENAHRREHDTDQRAVKLAVDNIDRRLDELNQLRKEVITDRSRFVQSDTYEADLKAVKVEMRAKDDAQSARTDALEKIIDRFEGSINTWRAIAGFLGVTGIGAILYALTQSGQ